MEGNIKLDIDVDSTRRYLTSQQWPESLQDVLVKGCQTFPIRYFIIDDSGEIITFFLFLVLLICLVVLVLSLLIVVRIYG